MSDKDAAYPDEATKKKGSLLTKLKIAAVAIVLILAVIVILQNTESVETKILFMDLKMPRAMLLFLCFFVGAGVGFFLAFLRPWRKNKE